MKEYRTSEWFGYKPPIGRDQKLQETEEMHMNRISSEGWRLISVLQIVAPFSGVRFYWEKVS